MMSMRVPVVRTIVSRLRRVYARVRHGEYDVNEGAGGEDDSK